MEPWIAPNQECAPPKPGEPALHLAARVGDHAAIKRLAAEGADLNQVFDIRLDKGARTTLATPLMVAAGSGDGANLETVRLLISLGADPELLLSNHTAATFAARGLGWNYRPGGDSDRLEFLLKMGVPVAGNAKIAARAMGDVAAIGDVQRLRALLDAGCDANGVDTNVKGKSAGVPDMLAGLLDNKFVKDRLESIGLLSSEAKTSKLFPFEIPLFMASASGNAEAVGCLVERGADLAARDRSGETALFLAGSQAVVDTLIERGLSLEDVNSFGWTVLTAAVSTGITAIDLAGWLINAGADVNATHDRGYTVFMSAASSMERDVEVLTLLVDSGADPFAVTELGYNAFHAAIDVSGPDANTEDSIRQIFGYLSELGVDINAKNAAGQTPLARANEVGTELERQVLRELGAEL